MLEMPFRRDDGAEKPVELRAIGNEFAVEVANVPIVKDIADIEDDGPDWRSGTASRRRAPFFRFGKRSLQPWRALKRRLVLLMT